MVDKNSIAEDSNKRIVKEGNEDSQFSDLCFEESFDVTNLSCNSAEGDDQFKNTKKDVNQAVKNINPNMLQRFNRPVNNANVTYFNNEKQQSSSHNYNAIYQKELESSNQIKRKIESGKSNTNSNNTNYTFNNSQFQGSLSNNYSYQNLAKQHQSQLANSNSNAQLVSHQTKRSIVTSSKLQPTNVKNRNNNKTDYKQFIEEFSQKLTK